VYLFTSHGDQLQNGHFLNLRWQNEQTSSNRQNKLNIQILKSIEHHHACETYITSIINNITMAKSTKCNPVGFLLLTIDFDTYTETGTALSRYSND